MSLVSKTQRPLPADKKNVKLASKTVFFKEKGCLLRQPQSKEYLYPVVPTPATKNPSEGIAPCRVRLRISWQKQVVQLFTQIVD